MINLKSSSSFPVFILASLASSHRHRLFDVLEINFADGREFSLESTGRMIDSPMEENIIYKAFQLLVLLMWMAIIDTRLLCNILICY